MQLHRRLTRSLAVLGAAVTVLVGPAVAQQGSLDQLAPFDHALFMPVGWSMQQQVNAGRDGLLEGVEVLVDYALTGSTFQFNVRRGPAWNTSAPLWSSVETVTLASGGADEVFFIDVSSAGIQLVQDEPFTLEVITLNDQNSTLNYRVYHGPNPYPEPLYVNGQPFASGNYNLTFRTWMEGSIAQRYCSTAANSHSTDGAVMSVSGSASVSAGDLVLTTSRVPNNAGLYYFGPDQVSLPFGNGTRCVGGAIVRLPVVVNEQHLMVYAVDYSIPAAAKLAAGSTWNFQAWYRDPAAQPAGFNFSDAVQITFVP